MEAIKRWHLSERGDGRSVQLFRQMPKYVEAGIAGRQTDRQAKGEEGRMDRWMDGWKRRCPFIRTTYRASGRLFLYR